MWADKSGLLTFFSGYVDQDCFFRESREICRSARAEVGKS